MGREEVRAEGPFDGAKGFGVRDDERLPRKGTFSFAEK
jgi:hypothetical protein